MTVSEYESSEAGNGGDDNSSQDDTDDGVNSPYPAVGSGAYAAHPRYEPDGDGLVDLRKYQYRYWPTRYGVEPRNIPHLPQSGPHINHVVEKELPNGTLQIPALWDVLEDIVTDDEQFGRVDDEIYRSIVAWMGYHDTHDGIINLDALHNDWGVLYQQMQNDARGALTAATVAYRIMTGNVDADVTVEFPNDRSPRTLSDIDIAEDTNGLAFLEGVIATSHNAQARVTGVWGHCGGPHQHAVVETSDYVDDMPTLGDCPHCTAQGMSQHAVDKDDEDVVNSADGKIREQYDGGRNQMELDAILEDDALSEHDVGDRVEMMVIVDRIDDGSNTQDIVIYPVSMRSAQNDHVEVSDEEEQDIREEVAENEDIVDDVQRSIAPHLVSGSERPEQYDRARLAAALQLAACHDGPLYGDEEDTAVRPMMHMALIGPPSTGKSDIAEAAAELAAVSEYADGLRSTKAGITAATVQEETPRGNTKYELRAGTIPRADGGLAVLDEADDMPYDVVRSLQTPLSRGKVEVDTAGAGSLPAETSILLVANPDEDAWDSYTIDVEQLPDNIPRTILSRFDAVLKVADNPDDRSANYRKAATEKASERREYEVEWLKKYFQLCREIEPQFTDSAWEMTKAVFDKLRSVDGDGMRIDTRTLDSIRRIGVALARMHLSETVTTDHVERAVDYITTMLQDVAQNEYGEVDPQKLRGTSRAERKAHQQVQVIATTMTDMGDSSTFQLDELRERVEKVVPEELVEQAIDKAKSSDGILQAAGAHGYTVSERVENPPLVEADELRPAFEE